MPLGTPGDPSASQWQITAQSLDSAGDYPVTFNVQATTDNPDAPAVPGIVQKFVDMIRDPHLHAGSAHHAYRLIGPPTPTRPRAVLHGPCGGAFVFRDPLTPRRGCSAGRGGTERVHGPLSPNRPYAHARRARTLEPNVTSARGHYDDELRNAP
jgi:hypothetical protein